MRCDGRDNTKNLWSVFPFAVPSGSKNENKTKLNGYSDFEESLFWSDNRNDNG